MKTIILVALVAVAIASAAIIPEEEETVDKRFLKSVIHKIKHTVHHIKHEVEHTVKHIGDQIKDVFSKHTVDGIVHLIKKPGEDILNSIKKTFKITTKSPLPKAFLDLFNKHSGKYLGHFLDKAGHDVGHFFSREIKEVTHISVFKNDKLRHFFETVYKKTKHEVNVLLRNEKFDYVMHTLIGMIDSPLTEKLCSELVAKIIDAVSESPAGDSLSPAIDLVCKAALKLIEMGADYGFTIAEEKAKEGH